MQQRRSKNFLVTGGAGFIGSHLCEALLRRGDSLVALDNFDDFYAPEIKRAQVASVREVLGDAAVINADIRDAAAVESVFARHRFDGVLHLAARAGIAASIAEPRRCLDTNIAGTLNLLEACRAHGIGEFIFASSSSVYGVDVKPPFAEDAAIGRTISPYAASKLAGEQLCSNYAHLYGLRCACLRFFTVYGPRQRPDLAIAKFTAALQTGHPITVHGDGTSARDYTYVDDILSGVLAATDFLGTTPAGAFEVFNLGGSAVTTLCELIAMLENAVGKKAIVESRPARLGDMPLTCADISKARKLLGYTPKTPVRDGLVRYVQWTQQGNS